MIIYIVYEKNYEDTNEQNINIRCAFKSKRKAIRKAKSLIDNAKKIEMFTDEKINNKRNPFKKSKKVDFYRKDGGLSKKVASIIMEQTKLIA